MSETDVCLIAFYVFYVCDKLNYRTFSRTLLLKCKKVALCTMNKLYAFCFVIFN